MPTMTSASPEERKGESVNGKQGWTGIVPSPKVFEGLDFEEISVLALLAWASAANRPVTARDVASLPDRNGSPLGQREAEDITRELTNLGVISVRGMHNDRPLSVFVGGFQPASAARRPGLPRMDYPKAEPDQLIENKAGNLPPLRTTRLTPAFVPGEAKKLREALLRVEAGHFGDDLVSAAAERKRILEERIALYRRWLNLESNHPVLGKFLERKLKALPELEYQLERARMPGGSKREQKRRAEQAEETE